jgi:hypothetical protein
MSEEIRGVQQPFVAGRVFEVHTHTWGTRTTLAEKAVSSEPLNRKGRVVRTIEEFRVITLSSQPPSLTILPPAPREGLNSGRFCWKLRRSLGLFRRPRPGGRSFHSLRCRWCLKAPEEPVAPSVWYQADDRTKIRIHLQNHRQRPCAQASVAESVVLPPVTQGAPHDHPQQDYPGAPPLRCACPQQRQLSELLALLWLCSLLSDAYALLREPLEHTCDVHRALLRTLR